MVTFLSNFPNTEIQDGGSKTTESVKTGEVMWRHDCQKIKKTFNFVEQIEELSIVYFMIDFFFMIDLQFGLLRIPVCIIHLIKTRQEEAQELLHLLACGKRPDLLYQIP